jgi:hypothetical protein
MLATTQGQLFDYNALEAINRLPIQQAETEITTLFNRSVRNFIKIGQKLREVHHRFPTVELFTAWFEAKFNGSQRTAYNLMKLAERFCDVSDEAISNIGLSTLYELAAASVPESARHAALQLAGDGHQVTSEIADTLIEQAKQREADAQGSFFAAAPEPEANLAYEEIPVCLCGHRADRHANVDCEDCPCEQFDEAPAGQDDVSIYKFVSPVKLDTRPFCLCEHTQDDHEDGLTNCKFCNCDCFQSERADHSNVETLVEQTETTTVEVLPPVKLTKQAKEDVGAQMRGAADLLFESRKITLQVVLQPKKGDDRDCMLALWEGSEFPFNSMCKWSQISDALTINMPISSLILAMKADLVEKADAAKKVTPQPAAPAAAKAVKKTTKTTKTKGKK